MLKVLELIAIVTVVTCTIWSMVRKDEWLPEAFVGLGFTALAIIEFATDGNGWFLWFTIFMAVFSFWIFYMKLRNAVEDRLDA